MTIIEIKGNLFDLPHGYCFAHCISADLALGAGIALQFNELYDMRERLKEIRDGEQLKPGDIVPVDNVFNMITKNKCYHKPTYVDLRITLETLADYVGIFKVRKLAMPQIGCGLDRLDWDIVKPMIEEVFADSNMDIVICSL